MLDKQNPIVFEFFQNYAFKDYSIFSFEMKPELFKALIPKFSEYERGIIIDISCGY